MNGKRAIRALSGSKARISELAGFISYNFSLISYNSCVSNAHHHHHHSN